MKTESVNLGGSAVFDYDRYSARAQVFLETFDFKVRFSCFKMAQHSLVQSDNAPKKQNEWMWPCCNFFAKFQFPFDYFCDFISSL